MKIVLLITFLIHSTIVFGQEKNLIAITTYNTIKILSGEIDPSNLLKLNCGEWDKVEEKETCTDYELEAEMSADPVATNANMDKIYVEHCSYIKGESAGKFCFKDQDSNEFIIRNDGAGANSLMMSYLCTDDYLDKSIKIAFGPCAGKGKHLKSEKMNCFCDYVNDQVKGNLAWHCIASGN